MHARNVCNHPVDFGKFASKYAFFKPYVLKNERNQRLMLDFKDDDAIRALNRCLLLEHFQLDIDIPNCCLIPRIPLRLNYLLWIEDLLTEHESSCKIKVEGMPIIRGLDIGTGPCAIYAVLGARNSGWKMVGTEISAKSVEKALENVKKNKLQDSVSILKVKGNSMFEPLKDCGYDHFDFTMCNPPFFSDSEDVLLKNETPTFWTEKSSSDNEIICKGGEVQFISKMFQESARHRIARIFTTMIGVKKHLTVIIKMLKEANFTNFATTSFQQGKNHRWGLAWSWDESVQFGKTKDKEAKRKTFHLEFPRNTTRDEVWTKTLKLFEDLQFKVSPHENGYEVKAMENTWSHGRRKRRLKLRQQELGKNSTDQIQEPQSKVPRLEQCTSEASLDTSRADSSTDQMKTSADPVLHFTANVDSTETNENKNPVLRLDYLNGVLGSDGVHQILQYVKNCLQPETL